MQLEGLRYPITPLGMHYLLIHFDIPHLHPATYELPVTGRVRNPLKLSLEDIRARPKVTMPVHALMIPPRIPDFLTRKRHVGAGRMTIEGRAWSGFGPIERVEFSADGGNTWYDAVLGDAVGRYGWTSRSIGWDARPGEHELCVRATDASGRTQPLDGEEVWNQGGYGINVIQRVPVRVG